jgi:ubiquinone/menaquinone biosynthesis C-methylase UbiE
LDNKKIIEKYYLEFKEISYKGAAGFGFNLIWARMENRFMGKHFEKVLEVGATHLEHLKYIKHSYAEYFATDLNEHTTDPEIERMIQSFGKSQQVTRAIADAENLPYPDEHFDRVLTTCLFHHLSFPEKAMQEMLRVTKVGGTISFFLPYDPGITFRLIRFLSTRRRGKKLHRQGKIEDPLLIWALEHRNHVGGLRVLIREIYGKHQMTRNYIPPYFKSWNLGLAEIYHITKCQK